VCEFPTTRGATDDLPTAQLTDVMWNVSVFRAHFADVPVEQPDHWQFGR